jgi:hypothetical protein
MKKPARPGRPPLAKGAARSETIRIRLTPAEKAAIEAQGGNPSEWARKRLLTGLPIKQT